MLATVTDNILISYIYSFSIYFALIYVQWFFFLFECVCVLVCVCAYVSECVFASYYCYVYDPNNRDVYINISRLNFLPLAEYCSARKQ